jgi:zinc protease
LSALRLLPAAALLLSLGCAMLPTGTPIWEEPPPPAKDAPVLQPSRLHRATLANGLDVLILVDSRLPAFQAGMVARRGAAIETRNEAGLAEFTAELMQRGAGDRDALRLAGAVDDLGASLGVGASWDAVSVSVSGLSRDRELLLDVLADVVLAPRFAREEAKRVRNEQLAVLQGVVDDPGRLAANSFLAAVYPDHRFGLPSGGSEASVARLDAAAARAFHARVFTPSNAILYVTGDVNPQAMLLDAEARFGSWRGPDPPAEGAPPAAPAARRIVVVDRPELGQAQVIIGHEGIRRGDADRLEVQLMNAVLGASGFSSRLMSRIRAEEGLTYSIGSNFSQRRKQGPFAVQSFTRIPEVGRLVGGILEELERMRSEPPDAEELAFAQSLRVGNFALALETSEAVASTLVDLDVHDLPRDSLDTYRARVRAVTTEGTTQAALDHIHPERAIIVAVGPAEALREQLEAFGDVEVVQP